MRQGDSAFVAIVNNFGTLSSRHAPIGIQAMVRDLAQRVRHVLAELAMPEESSNEDFKAGGTTPIHRNSAGSFRSSILGERDSAHAREKCWTLT